ncbi:chemotaxis protein CheW [Cohnella sp.]|uniref:chemotaxis protein CheW n=1 Tax=Cohnella sp. TaxID=1883426 RepID=UPI003703C9E4
MDQGFSNDSILDIYIYETTQNIDQLEKTVMTFEKANGLTLDTVNEIFRIMHTIKGSSAMMTYNNIASLAHAMEDLFFYIREEKHVNLDLVLLSDLILEGIDFIKLELDKVRSAGSLDGDPGSLIETIRRFLSVIKAQGGGSSPPRARKEAVAAQPRSLPSGPGAGATRSRLQAYEAVIHFDDGCEMENIRAYAIVHHLSEIAEDFSYSPEDIVENGDSVHIIRERGFKATFRSARTLRELHDIIASTAFVRNLSLVELEDESSSKPSEQTELAIAELELAAAAEPRVKAEPPAKAQSPTREQAENKSAQQSFISVDVDKLDKLMDLMGEMVIAEAMVTQNPEIKALQLGGFDKAARQLRKITSEMRDMVMSIRMVPLSATFHKMHRIVRDMGRKLDKELELTLIGEATEVDKNIIEHISDPLMHLVRNAADHGIESSEARAASGKPQAGRITLEAQNAGSNVLVTVKDDGKGLSKDKILAKAKKQGLLVKAENEMTDKEIYNLIFLPGFSTNENVTEFSGRGVGMDVVSKNLEAVGGSVSIDSEEGAGTVTTLRIPLTLAIIDGMNIRVGSAKYTIPTTSIQETFQAKLRDIVTDPDSNEMILLRGKVYPILRLHELYSVPAAVADLTEGIMLMVEQDGKSVCLFADALLGQQQVVVKALPGYIANNRRIEGLAGCTLLGDGSISLILNIGGLLNKKSQISSQ